MSASPSSSTCPGRRSATHLVVPHITLDAGLSDRGRRRPRHHHQPLPVLLAGRARRSRRSRNAPDAKPLERAPEQARGEFARIRVDTYLGMGLSNRGRLFIIITTAATLHAHGDHRHPDLVPGRRGAEADRRAASPSSIFALGIVGTGLLAVPVLAGSAAYAVGEAFGWHVGPGAQAAARAKAFYGIIAVATVIGVAAQLHPHRSDQGAVLERGDQWRGRRAGDGDDDAAGQPARRSWATSPCRRPLKIVGWLATAAMAAAAVGMFATMGHGRGKLAHFAGAKGRPPRYSCRRPFSRHNEPADGQDGPPFRTRLSGRRPGQPHASCACSAGCWAM